MNRKDRRAAAKRKDPESLCALAQRLEKDGKIAEAVDRFRQALDIDLSLHDAHIELARLLRQQGRLVEAIAHCEKALPNSPEPGAVFNNIGNMAMEIGDFARAIKCLRQ